MGACGSRAQEDNRREENHKIKKTDDFGGKCGESIGNLDPPSVLRIDSIVRPDNYRSKVH